MGRLPCLDAYPFESMSCQLAERTSADREVHDAPRRRPSWKVAGQRWQLTRNAHPPPSLPPIHRKTAYITWEQPARPHPLRQGSRDLRARRPQLVEKRYMTFCVLPLCRGVRGALEWGYTGDTPYKQKLQIRVSWVIKTPSGAQACSSEEASRAPVAPLALKLVEGDFHNGRSGIPVHDPWDTGEWAGLEPLKAFIALASPERPCSDFGSPARVFHLQS